MVFITINDLSQWENLPEAESLAKSAATDADKVRWFDRYALSAVAAIAIADLCDLFAESDENEIFN